MTHFSARRAVIARLTGLTLCISLTACNGGLPDLKGRFQGTQNVGTKDSQVVAQVPSFQANGERFSIAFKVFETLASAPGASLSLSFGTGTDVELNAPEISSTPIQLVEKNSCADGAAAGTSVHLCWATGKIDLDATGSGGAPVYSLHIQ